jgi:hypothetical protein
MSEDFKNPFAVQTPEDLPAEDAVSLFVDVFTDFHHIPNPGHTFLNGHRGCGKSMMFRYLEPDCQQLARGTPFGKLPFFGVYVPIKNTEIKLTEFQRLENKHADLVLNEHFLVVYVAVKFFASLMKANIEDKSAECVNRVRQYYEAGFKKLLESNGWRQSLNPFPGECNLEQAFKVFQDLFSDYYGLVLTYLKKLAFTTAPIPYDGPLFGYIDFLFRLMKEVRNIGFMPPGPIFLLIDDADNLNATQTRILNSWVSSRTSRDVSLKISTQLNYKTFLTATRQSIASPHDYLEINVSDVYTSEKDRYMTRVEQIVGRRLKMSKILKTPQEFFPKYERQEREIEEIGQELRKRWETEKRGYRARDDATRYARPEYIKRLQGPSKSGPTYRYAGFEQLVHLSSGIIRYFLEAASLMYGEMRSKVGLNSVLFIDPAVQDDVARKQAEEFFFSEFEKLELDQSHDAQKLGRIKKLRNLIWALGGTFHEILVSDASERRVFSIALSDEPDDELLSVFKLGVQYGYFHQSAIGNKEGTGRTRLYILSRRLAPMFTLDPTSFAGYKFAKAEAIHEAMENPKRFLGKIQRGNIDDLLQGPQLHLFGGA